jgi:hypothetical protein
MRVERDSQEGDELMETYTLYPPQGISARVPYHVVAEGEPGCKHELEEASWQDSLAVQDGILFVYFSCRHCGRKLSQSFDEVLPPRTWKASKAA